MRLGEGEISGEVTTGKSALAATLRCARGEMVRSMRGTLTSRAKKSAHAYA